MNKDLYVGQRAKNTPRRIKKQIEMFEMGFTQSVLSLDSTNVF